MRKFSQEKVKEACEEAHVIIKIQEFNKIIRIFTMKKKIQSKVLKTERILPQKFIHRTSFLKVILVFVLHHQI